MKVIRKQQLAEICNSALKIRKNKDIPHCTNPECPFFHHHDPDDTSWRKEHGSYYTAAFGDVQRYRCTLCGKTFSEQSFSLDYYVKHPVDYVPLIRSLVSTSGMGNLGRFENLRCELIENRYERLARSFLALQAHLRQKIMHAEDFVLDGFESFSCSQYYPNNINILVGSDSEFIYTMGFAQLRRKGRMTAEQKQKRAELELLYGKAPPKAVEVSAASLLEDLAKSLQHRNIQSCVLYSDEHTSYPKALDRLGMRKQMFQHVQISSKKARTFQNPLFPVNYVDRQFRKDQANQVRETVQFSRCPSAMMLRLTIYQVYHNFIMPKRVKEQRQGNWDTRGEAVGISRTDISEALYWIIGRRVFFHKSDLWSEERQTWLSGWRNSQIPLGRYVPNYISV